MNLPPCWVVFLVEWEGSVDCCSTRKTLPRGAKPGMRKSKAQYQANKNRTPVASFPRSGACNHHWNPDRQYPTAISTVANELRNLERGSSGCLSQLSEGQTASQFTEASGRD